jgi:hypothetical protein
MTVHIEEMTSEINVTSDELPLSPKQIEQLVTILLQRLELRQRDSKRTREATSLHSSVIPQPTRSDR